MGSCGRFGDTSIIHPESMKAIILAAGYGNRMRPLTDTGHKTLLEVGGQTILGRIVDGLRQVGISHILVVTGYRADEVDA